jgi:hypothetical protein
MPFASQELTSSMKAGILIAGAILR